eukprot:gene2548-3154_t
MKIIFFAIGTRGDVAPSCILGSELKSRGHQVAIATEERTRPIVEQFKLDYFKVEGDFSKIIYDKDEHSALKQGGSELKTVFMKKKETDKNNPLIPHSYYLASVEFQPDMIIASGLAIPEGYTVSEKLGVPFVNLLLFPCLVTSEFPLIVMTAFYNFYFGIINRFTYKLLDMFMTKHDSERLLPWRTKYLDMGPMPSDYLVRTRNLPSNVILAFDEILYPNQKVPHDYQDNWYTTGFLFHNSDVTGEIVPDYIQKFVINENDSQDRPIVFGIGSMEDYEPNKTLYTVLKVAQSIRNKKVVVVRGLVKYSLESLFTQEHVENDLEFQNYCQKNVLIIDYINHEWLYPKSSCIIYHGGVGSTASVLKSGVPAIVTWLFVDQPYWGKRLEELGIGKSIKFTSLNQQNLYQAMNEILSNPKYLENAIKYSNQIKLDGKKKASDLIEKIYLNSKTTSK